MGLDPLSLLAVAAIGATYQSGKAQQKSAQQAAQQAQANAQQQAKAAEEAMNRANQKRANPEAALSAAALAGKAGNSATMLTGPQGIDQSTLLLGRNTLLGA